MSEWMGWDRMGGEGRGGEEREKKGAELFLSDIQIQFRNECILFTVYYFSPVYLCLNIAQMPHTNTYLWARTPRLPDNTAECKVNIQILDLFLLFFFL